MARIAGVNVSDNKHTEIALTAIYGIGRVTAKKICDATGITATTKIKDLSDADLEKLRDHIGGYEVEGDLRREVTMNINNLSVELQSGAECRVGVRIDEMTRMWDENGEIDERKRFGNSSSKYSII